MSINYREQDQVFTLSEEDEAAPALLSSSPVKEVDIEPDVISSPSTEYLIQSFLGEGFFGKVARCIKATTGETVAVKIMKKGLDIEAKNELAILQHLSVFNSDRYNFVRCNNVFMARGHVCLEFEMLEMSLWDFQWKRPSPCFSMKEIRPILHQMATTLQLLESTGVVHTDLKPDNIMLVDHVNQPLKIKMIDFGCAIQASGLGRGFYLQALHYRSPEVILGLPLTSAIDIWSLGCIVAELFLGHVLYPVNSSYDMLRHMERTQGQIPQRLLREGYNTRRYFCKNRRRNQWRLKTPSEFGQRVCTNSLFSSLRDLLMLRPPCHLLDEDNKAEMVDRENFIELLKKMLHLDLRKRILPSKLFEDPFISMNNLADSYPNSLYVKSSFEMMKVCQEENLSADNSSTTSTTFSASLQTNISLQDTSVWDIYQESPVVQGIASEFSQISIQEPPAVKEKMSPGKWSKDSSETSHTSGETSPEGTLPAESRMNSKWEFQRITRQKRKEMNDVSTQASASAPIVKLVHRRTQTPANFTITHSCSRASTGSSERKRMEMSLHHEAPPKTIMKRVRKRKWDTYKASNTGKSAPKPDSPKRKKMKMSLLLDSKEAPTEALSSEVAMKRGKKRTWRSYKASDTRKSALKPDSPERKKMKMSLRHVSK